MNIFKAMAVANPEEASRAIPVIDFGPAFRSEPGGLPAVARQVGHASETVGFFYLAGHGVPQAVIDDAFQASREFHAIGLTEKLALKINENNIGYLPVNQSMQRHSTVHKATRPNFNESFFISHDRAADHPDVVAGTSLRGRNHWPAGHERMRATMVRYMKAMEGLGERTLPVPRIGDLAVVGGAGAYCASMAAKNYNSIPAAPEAMRRADGSFALVRRRQTLADVLREEDET